MKVKTFVRMALLGMGLVLFSICAKAQDGICGNQSVYTVCGQDTRCIDGLCMYCVWFVTYDNPSCDYSVEGCVCMVASNKPREEENHAKALLARIRNRARNDRG